MTDHRTEADAIAEIAARVQIPFVVDEGSLHLPHITVGADGRAHVTDVTAFARKPRDVREHVIFTEVESWLAYVERFRTPETILFGNPETATVDAVFDYHADSATPGLCENRATWKMRTSDEWRAWSAIDGQLMRQDAFAEHLVGHRGEVLRPDAATMLELAQSFQATTEVAFKSRVSLETGAVTFLVDEKVEGTGMVGERAVKAPQTLTLRMPVIAAGAPLELTARLRWRTVRDGLRLGIVIEQAAQIIRQAFTDAVTGIETATELRVLR